MNYKMNKMYNSSFSLIWLKWKHGQKREVPSMINGKHDISQNIVISARATDI